MADTQDQQLVADIEAIRVGSHLLSPSTRAFALSLVDFHRRKGYVTAGQRPHVSKIAEECRNLENFKRGNEADTIEEVFDGTHVRALFDKAATSLKYPRITYRVAGIPGDSMRIYLAGPMSRNPGWVVFSNGKQYPEKRVYATVDIRGEGQITRNLPASIKGAIRKFAASPVERAKLSGIAFSNCCFCGLGLTHPISLHHGYGPICATNYGLPWEGDAEATKAAKQKEVELFPLDGLDKLGLEDL